MAHVVDVDQSIKIEQSGATVLAFSNEISYAIVVPTSAKTKAFHILQDNGKSKETAHLLLFAACIFIIRFGLIGKSSGAHIKAYNVRRKKDKNYRKISEDELINIIL